MDTVLARTQLDLFWLPPTVTRLERADVLALHDGTDNFLHNQVARTLTTDDKIPALIEEISAFHSSGSQWLVVPPGNLRALETHLPDHGYQPEFQGDGYSVDTASTWSEGELEVVQVCDLRTLRDNLDAGARGFDRAVRIPEAGLARQLEMCTGPAARTARFVVYAQDEPVAAGNINRYDALGFGFLWAGATVPEYRGRGAYRALLGARCRWARARGMERVGLYANRKTSAPVVAGLGFSKHGPMAYWKRKDPRRSADE